MYLRRIGLILVGLVLVFVFLYLAMCLLDLFYFLFVCIWQGVQVHLTQIDGGWMNAGKTSLNNKEGSKCTFLLFKFKYISFKFKVRGGWINASKGKLTLPKLMIFVFSL